MDRRTFLRGTVAAAAGAAGVVSLAACDSDGDGYDDSTGEYVGGIDDDSDDDGHSTSRTRSRTSTGGGSTSGRTSGRSTSGSTSGRSTSGRSGSSSTRR
jgi:hypothetical protein